jgi:hypothetical protein
LPQGGFGVIVKGINYSLANIEIQKRKEKKKKKRNRIE